VTTSRLFGRIRESACRFERKGAGNKSSLQYRLIYCLLLLYLAGTGCHGSNSHAAGNPQSVALLRLTDAGRSLQDKLVTSGKLPDLHWPDFQREQVEVRQFYSSVNGTLPWIQDLQPTPQARAVIEILQAADKEGLRPEGYDGPLWKSRLATFAQKSSLSESDLVRFDLALTVCTMRYISDLHMGRMNPRMFHIDLDIGHEPFDLSQFLEERLIHAPDVPASLRQVEPPFPGYQRTVVVLQKYSDLARQNTQVLLPIPSKPVHPGESYSYLAQLAQLLASFGDLPPQKEFDAASMIYQQPIVDALKHYQQRNGLDVTGAIDSVTVKELNVPMSARVA